MVRSGLLALAVVLCGASAVMNDAWWVRHVVVPACYLTPPAWVHPTVRAGLVALALLLLAAAALLPRMDGGGLARVALSFALALCASEVALRILKKPERATRHPRLEWLLGVADPRTGWSFVPGASLRFGAPGGGPVIDYAIDAHGDRGPTGFVEDGDAPTLLVTGESIAVGHGLQWPDTFAAQAGARLGLQVVNVAEGGYGNDQALLRAREALRRLRKPVALVSTFLPVQLHRNLNDARPHLALREGALALAPAVQPRLLLRELLVDDLQILPERRLRESLRLTRAILEETVREARDRGARPLFVVPLYGDEPGLVRELLAGLPHAVVRIDPARLMPWDGHPDRDGARQMANAIVAALEQRE